MSKLKGSLKLAQDSVGWENIRKNEEREGSEVEDKEGEVRDEVEESKGQERMADSEAK